MRKVRKVRKALERERVEERVAKEVGSVFVADLKSPTMADRRVRQGLKVDSQAKAKIEEGQGPIVVV